MQELPGGVHDERGLMKPEEQKAFFQSCLALKDDQCNSFSYSMVRAQLVNSLTETKTLTELDAFGGCFQPLGSRFENTVLQCERACKKRKDPSLALPKGKAAAKAKVKPALPDEQLALKSPLAEIADLQSDSDDENLKVPWMLFYSASRMRPLFAQCLLFVLRLWSGVQERQAFEGGSKIREGGDAPRHEGGQGGPSLGYKSTPFAGPIGG